MQRSLVTALCIIVLFSIVSSKPDPCGYYGRCGSYWQNGVYGGGGNYEDYGYDSNGGGRNGGGRYGGVSYGDGWWWYGEKNGGKRGGSNNGGHGSSDRRCNNGNCEEIINIGNGQNNTSIVTIRDNAGNNTGRTGGSKSNDSYVVDKWWNRKNGHGSDGGLSNGTRCLDGNCETQEINIGHGDNNTNNITVHGYDDSNKSSNGGGREINVGNGRNNKNTVVIN